MQYSTILSEVDRQKDDMVNALIELIRIPAIAPENGGEGETEKAEKLMQLLENMNFDKIEHFEAEDNRVPSKKRPNIVAYSYGKNKSERLWIITHLDVVPPGENSLWTITKPFEPTIREGRVYGRGSEDNGQSMIASIFAVKALESLKIKPKRTVALAFVADEEQGSKYGIQYLAKQGIFKKDDLIVVPDGGNEDGSFIEIAEKSALWFRIRTIGKQTHASMPDKGLNAHRIGMEYALALDKMLHQKYSLKNQYFNPPESTFEPTKKEKNVDAVNIVPGEDITYFDCRILPDYDPEEILNEIKELAKAYEKKTGATIKIEVLQKSIAPKPTDAKAKIVTMLKDAIRKIKKVEPKAGGIGGGTCAAFFRRINIPAVVWSTIDETAHQPNEYAKIENMVNDAKIFAFLTVSE
ncbi:MAG: M20 family metallo-hydrolase [Candidatus Bathyarchaeota archaeon]|jgi:succinyl-diaminopimelate desuccinylase|nr:M20 family metallo-hydrolase [Candidatus Bathyarchaeota archaeon A05DMB-5]MDH7557841.1 M20 family metallo-hydrolase [Candidatus Bathyarchaeota archaeon]